MSINEFVNVATSVAQFPSTNALQARFRDTMADQSGEAAKKLAAALGFAILDLEIALVTANAERLQLKAYVLELEARILNADIALDDPPTSCERTQLTLSHWVGETTTKRTLPTTSSTGTVPATGSPVHITPRCASSGGLMQ